MSGVLLLVVSMVILMMAYLLPGTRLAKRWGIHKEQPGIGFRKRDDMDYIPANTPVLFGHHFSSVAGIGFLAGTIQAAAFGWLPALLWLLLGGIFFGALFDFSSLLLSVRNQGKSIGTVMKRVVSTPSGILVLLYSWGCLVTFSAYLVDVAANIMAGVELTADGSVIRNASNGSVAMAVLLLLALAVMFGFINRARMNLAFTTVMGGLLLILAIAIGIVFPIFITKEVWILLLLVYVFLAAVVPIWALLQPKDYLSSILFFALILLSVIGICLGRPTMEIPAFVNWITEEEATIFPALFLFLGSGTVSGLHGLVAAGTTSKQIKKETQIKRVGYGSMLLVCLVCVIALIVVGSGDLGGKTLADITGTDSGLVRAFAKGLGGIFASVGLPAPGVSVVRIVVLFMIGALALTSLDTLVRTGRYLLQELFTGKEEKKSLWNSRLLAAAVTVLAVGALSFGGYKNLRRLFDGANLLLAAVLLVGISCWMKSMGRKHKLYYLPIGVLLGVAWSDLGLVFLENTEKILRQTRGWDVTSVLQNLVILFMMVMTVTVLTDGIHAIFFAPEKEVDPVEETEEDEELPPDWEEW